MVPSLSLILNESRTLYFVWQCLVRELANIRGRINSFQTEETSHSFGEDFVWPSWSAKDSGYWERSVVSQTPSWSCCYAGITMKWVNEWREKVLCRMRQPKWQCFNSSHLVFLRRQFPRPFIVITWLKPKREEQLISLVQRISIRKCTSSSHLLVPSTVSDSGNPAVELSIRSVIPNLIIYLLFFFNI